jgi:hypothetical protein
MTEFLVDQTASTEIKRIFSASAMRDPVAELYELTPGGPVLAGGSETRRELIERARARSLDEPKGQERIHIHAHERAEFEAMHLREINGITFFMPIGFFRLLANVRLTFDGERFLLLGADQVVFTFESLANRTL